MTASERLYATLTGAPRDRRPWAPVLSLYGQRYRGCSVRRYLSEPEEYTQGQLAVVERLSPDVVYAPFCLAGLGEAFGGELHWFDSQAPNLRRPGFHSLEELEQKGLPDFRKGWAVPCLLEATRGLAKELQGTVPLAVVLPSPMDLPVLALGMEGWLEALLFQRERAEALISGLEPLFVSLVEELKAAGATVLVLACGLLSPVLVTRELASSFLHPRVSDLLRRLPLPVVLHPLGGPILPHLDLLQGLPQVVGHALHTGEDLLEARQKLGLGSVLFAGPGGPRFGLGDVACLLEEVRGLLREAGADRTWVLYTSGADVAPSVPESFLLALRSLLEQEASP